GFAVRAYKKCKSVSMFLYANTPCFSGHQVWKALTFVGTFFLHLLSLFRAPRKVQEASSMNGNHSFFGIIIQTLANDDECLTVSVTRRIGEIEVSSQRYIA